MPLDEDAQRLDPGALIELYSLDATLAGGAIHRFTPSSRGASSLRFGGIEYLPWPIHLEGAAVSSGGDPPRPRLKVAALGGALVGLAIAADDLVGCRLIRLRTLARYLDAGADPDPDQHWPAEVWRIERKLEQTAEALIFELATPLDQEAAQLPGRLVVRLCPRPYRRWDVSGQRFLPGGGSFACPYQGEGLFDEADRPVADSAKDRCSHRLSGCEARYGLTRPLPFMGFPGAGQGARL